MASEVIVRQSCDFDEATSDTDTITTVPFIHNGKSYEVDMCSTCLKEHNAYMDGMSAVGRRTKTVKVRRDPGHRSPPGPNNPFPCKHRGCNKSFETQRGLKHHQTTVDHGQATTTRRKSASAKR